MLSKKLNLWEKGQYQSEMQDNFQPTLDTYILSGNKKRPAVLICPGGGYGFTSDREAEPIAMQFNAAGFHAFVLYYSIAPRRHPQPLMDVSRAMCIIRENANEWNIQSDKIAVCGFSAGGHLAASLGVFWDEPLLHNVCGITRGMNQPNALILCYPVITSGEYAHRGSFINLLGEQADEKILAKMSLENQVNDETPPAFIWHTFSDSSVPVENSLFFAQAMRKKNIPFELHIYPEGPHGLSLANKETDNGNTGEYPHVATWINSCTEWLEMLFK
jgi:acetyl esterase/lipase